MLTFQVPLPGQSWSTRKNSTTDSCHSCVSQALTNSRAYYLHVTSKDQCSVRETPAEKKVRENGSHYRLTTGLRGQHTCLVFSLLRRSSSIDSGNLEAVKHPSAGRQSLCSGVLWSAAFVLWSAAIVSWSATSDLLSAAFVLLTAAFDLWSAASVLWSATFPSSRSLATSEYGPSMIKRKDVLEKRRDGLKT